MKRIGSFNIERCVLVLSYLVIWLGCWLNSFTWPPAEKAGRITGGIAVACCGVIYRAGDTIKEETVFVEQEAKILQLFR